MKLLKVTLAVGLMAGVALSAVSSLAPALIAQSGGMVMWAAQPQRGPAAPTAKPQ